MGQGTESCGGYDVDCDPYEEGLNSGIWTQRNGAGIRISKMTLTHLVGARRVAKRAADRAVFTDTADQMQEWVDAFDAEIASRGGEVERAPAVYVNGDAKRETRGAKAQMICHCGGVYLAREADLQRGWAKSCSKRCAAIRRDYGRPSAKRVVNPKD